MMAAATFRVMMWQASRRPQMLSKLVAGETLDVAVLCAAQWVVWSHGPERGKRAKFGFYSVHARGENDSWHEVATGTLADAKALWTDADEARIENTTAVKPLIGQQGTTRQQRAGTGRSVRRPQTRLAALVQKMQTQK